MKFVENKLQANVTRIKMYNIVQNGHIFKYALFFSSSEKGSASL